ncbi:MAG: hypothetical protein QG635_2278 [Bacteroidota bacterium]|nr:hypothetical protein [Bacteroidota bacterium]
MLECIVTEISDLKCITLSGRIDSMSSPEFDRLFKELTASGERSIIVDFSGVNYISSAGLRVFLSAQKQLAKAGGELICYNIPPGILQVFKISGFMQIFRIINDLSELGISSESEKSEAVIESRQFCNISINYSVSSVKSGILSIIGNQDLLPDSEFDKESVVSVKPSEIKYGTGLAALGENYDEYKEYFGEAIVMNHNLFFYPAVKRPAVDFMIFSPEENSMEYRFLHGFSFSGELKTLMSFEGIDGFVELPDLVNSFFEISKANKLGVVFLAESKGFWGMNLKRVPLRENKPEDSNIFDGKNFAEWMNFPVEPGDINNIIAGCGIAVRDKSLESESLQKLFSKDSNYHIHSVVFEKEILNKNPNEFESELKRITSELEPLKVQHVLGKTRFSGGVAGIIELS